LKVPDEAFEQFCALFDRHRGCVELQRDCQLPAVRGHAERSGCQRANGRVELDGSKQA
jgi:hypothetical protein